MADEGETVQENASESKAPSKVKRAIDAVVTGGQWLLLRVFAFSDKITTLEIRKGTFSQEGRSNETGDQSAETTVEQSGCAEEVLELAKELYEEEEKRLASVQDKIRALVSVCSLVLPIVVAFMPRLRHPGFALIPLLFVFASLLTLLIAIRLHNRSRPALGTELLGKDEDALRGSIAAGYLKAARLNEPRTSFLANVYRAAYAAFVWGLFALAFVAAVGAWDPAPPTALPAPMVTNTLVSATMPSPVVNVSATPSTQPAPTVNVIAVPTTQPAAVVNVIVQPPTQPNVASKVPEESKHSNVPTTGPAIH